MSNDTEVTPEDGMFAANTAREILAPFMRSATPETTVTLERHIKWARELLADCEAAIAAQQRITEHDGALEAHQLSLKTLTAEKAKLEADIRTLEASVQARPK